MGRIVIASLVIFLLCALPAAARAASCQFLKNFKTSIDIDLEVPPPVLDLSKTRGEINKDQNKQHEDWLKKNGMEALWSAGDMETAGTSAAGWAIASSFELTGKPHDEYGFEVCPYFKSVNLGMMYRTIISIPKEFEKDSCAYKVILVHEMKHHNTNVEIARQAIEKFKTDFPVMIAEMENATPFIDHRTVQQTFGHMQDETQDAIKVYFDQYLQSEMAKRNALVDSPEEYERGSRLLGECGVKRQ